MDDTNINLALNVNEYIKVPIQEYVQIITFFFCSVNQHSINTLNNSLHFLLIYIYLSTQRY